jgi:DNA-binding response OmpR family regulator
MTDALTMVIQERDAAQAEAARLRAILADITSSKFDLAGEPKPFTATQRRILSLLAAANGAIVRSTSLIEAAYHDDPNGGPQDSTLKVHVANIRKKLTAHEIRTEWGIGYRLVKR